MECILGRKIMVHKRNHKKHANRRENDRRWFKRHPEAIPDACQVCGKDDTILEFHHDSYDEPRIGRFVCKWCHDKIHGIGKKD
jgi:hypothetical protein